MWDIIINPFTTLLTFLYSLFGNNIVVAIIVFTIIVRLLMYPLTIQQQRSTKAMQELQPKLKKLQEKYKNDREKLAQAQMELYREHGVNPFAGCLPLFIQLPIFLALYQAIIHALADTPFKLIDLSGRILLPGFDNLIPLNNSWLGMNVNLPPTENPPFALVLPLLVLVTTWLQSKVTMPAPAPNADGTKDQTQAMTQSMTTIMPLMFGFFSLQFQVGLSIYFIVGNIIGIIQYTMMGKTDFRRLLGRGGTVPAVEGKAGSEEQPILPEKPRRTSEAKDKRPKKAARSK